MNFLNQAKDLVSKKTELEKTLDQALSNENWGASGTMLNDLAVASYNSADYTVINDAIWKTIGMQPKYWKCIFKALSLIDHLIRNGSPRMIDDARDKLEKLRSLQEFSFKEQQYERGNGIREKSALIIELLDDDQRLRFERKKAKELKQKMASRQNAVGGGAPPSAAPQQRQQRPMQRSRYDEDEDERPRRNKRYDDEEDDYKPKKKSTRRDVSDDEEKPKKKAVRRAVSDDDEEEEEKPKKKVVKKVKKAASPVDDEEEEEEKPKKKVVKKVKKAASPVDDDDEEEEKPKKKVVKKAPVKKAAAKVVEEEEDFGEEVEEPAAAPAEDDFMDMFGAMPSAAPDQQDAYGYGAPGAAYGGMVDLSDLSYGAPAQQQQQPAADQQAAYGYGAYGYGAPAQQGYGYGNQGFGGYGY